VSVIYLVLCECIQNKLCFHFLNFLIFFKSNQNFPLIHSSISAILHFVIAFCYVSSSIDIKTSSLSFGLICNENCNKLSSVFKINFYSKKQET